MRYLLSAALLMLSGLVVANEAFDPGIAAPKVDQAYYAGAEKVVFHLSNTLDEKGYLGVMGNVRNYINALEAVGSKTEAVVVLNGDGLGLLTMAKELELEAEAILPTRITELRNQGVVFKICYNTLIGRKIKFADLYDAKPEDIIPAGVAEVGRLQAQGYRLVKP